MPSLVLDIGKGLFFIILLMVFDQVMWKGDAGRIVINGTDYKLSQCHWHSPSEHTVNGTRLG